MSVVPIPIAGLRGPTKPAIKIEKKKEKATLPGTARLDDFYAYLPAHQYFYLPTGALWPAASVDSILPPVEVPMREKPMLPSKWLDQNRAVQQAAWAPGMSKIVDDKILLDGGWTSHLGGKVFNLYRPPLVRPPPVLGFDVKPWLDHVRYIFPEEAGHIVKWLAHRIQRPEEKINHAIVLGGAQGIGKDATLEPIKVGVGAWNFVEVTPKQVVGRFNGFVRSVVLRISEARDQGDETDRYEFYEHMKIYTAAPPDVLRVDEKNIKECAVQNVMGVILTTNHRDALYLPSDHRRHFVCWSPREKEHFQEGYWPAFWRWLDSGGRNAVADYLANLDLSDFDAKAPPPKTAAFWSVVDLNRAPEDSDLADALDALGNPDAVTVNGVWWKASPGLQRWLDDPRNRRRIPFRFEACGYVPVRNETAKDGLWVISGKRQVIYAKRTMAPRDQVIAAAALTTPPSRSG
jgi:hypothetical protein